MTYASSVINTSSTRRGTWPASAAACARTVRFVRRASAFAALVILAAGLSGCNKLQARDRLNKGVAEFKNAQYDKAIEYFKEAKDLDPALMNARLYLATAYATQYIPGAPSDQNVRLGTQAVTEFKDVLSIDEKNPEPYYWIGVIDWTLAFRANGELRAAYNRDHVNKQVRDDDPLPPAVRAEYASKYGALVEEGITNLQKSIQVKPDYDDAMAYLNLLYRRKADMVESADERASLKKQADDLVDKVKEIKQRRAEQPQPGN